MASKSKRISGYLMVLVVTLSTFALVACGGGDAPPATGQTEQTPPDDTAPAETIVEEEELDALEVPQLDHALITFVTGDAYLERDGEEFLADIGDFLQPGERLSVDTGYVELQAGNLGSVRVQEATTIRLDDIVISPQGGSVDLRVVSGSVLNKVNRLAGNDSYEVRTETAVMGVRGTEFGVSVAEGQETRVAVREGRVAVVPPAADPDRIRARASESGVDAATVEAAIQALEDEAPVLEPNQEAELNITTAAAAEEAVAEIETVIAEVAATTAGGEQVDTADVAERFTAAARQSGARVGEQTEQTRRDISEESRRELEQIDEIRTIPVAATSDEEPAPRLVPVRLNVEPADARILLDGRAVGQGRFSAVFLPGEQLSFTIERDGFARETLNLTVDEERGRAYRVSLARRAPAEQAPEPEPEPEPDQDEEPAPEPVSLEISVQPASARILVNGQDVGTGSHTTDVLPGTEVAVRAELDGYDAVERRVTVAADQQPLRFSLERSVAGIRVVAEPDDAEIRINGQLVGRGTATVERRLGEQVEVQVSRDGFFTQRRSVTVEGTAEAVRFSLATSQASLAVSAVPADARIVIDGQAAGTGSASRSVPVDREITVVASRPGFAEARRTLTVDAEGASLELRLEPRPIEASIRVADVSLVRGMVSDGRRAYVADRNGTVHAVDPSGRLVWSAQTGNAGNENSQPVVGNGLLAFSGASELVIIDPANGTVVGRSPLTGSASHLFGRRLLAWNNGWLLPSDEQLAVLDRQGSATGQTIAIPGASKMSPAIAGSSLVIADQQGQVLVIDPDSGSVRATVGTGMSQPVALAPAVSGGSAFLVGRRGTAVAVDTASGSLQWEASLPGGQGAFTDPVVAGSSVLFFTMDSVVALSAADGSQRYVLDDAAAAPLFANGSVFYGTGSGLLRQVNPGSGAVQAELELPGRASGAPVQVGDRLIVPLADGRAVVVHPAGMQ